MRIIKDKKLLNKMKKDGFIVEPKYDFFPRVDNGKKSGLWGFAYRNKEYKFKYFIDGERWENDDAADEYVTNEHGTEDSVIKVGK